MSISIFDLCLLDQFLYDIECSDEGLIVQIFKPLTSLPSVVAIKNWTRYPHAI